MPLLLAGGVLIAGCRLLPGQAKDSQLEASLKAAARTRLTAESDGLEAGDPAKAASFSSGAAAVQDRLGAVSVAGQRSGGDTTDDGFDLLDLTVYPLDGASSYFLAYVKGRTHGNGGIFSEVELYQRAGAGPWKAIEDASLQANIDAPPLQLDSRGDGHLLSSAELQALGARPDSLAQRYASYAMAGESTGTPEAGAFQIGPFTSGEVRSEADQLESIAASGSAQFAWAPSTGGEGVALRSGTLVFAHVTETTTEQRGQTGSTQSYYVQDPERMNWGGLLAPGEYSRLVLVDADTFVFVVPRRGLPDAVAESDAATAITGTPFTP